MKVKKSAKSAQTLAQRMSNADPAALKKIADALSAAAGEAVPADPAEMLRKIDELAQGKTLQ